MKLISVLILFFYFSYADAYRLNEENYLSLYSGYGALASDLTGEGFNSNLPASGNTLYGIETSYQSDDSFNQYVLKYEKVSVVQNSPTGISPAKISTSREELVLLTKFSPWDSGVMTNMKVGIGYAFLSSKGSATSPSEVVTSQYSQGLILNVSQDFEVFDDTKLKPGASIYLPHRFSETPKSTGNNQNYLGIELCFRIERSFTESLLGFVGAHYRVDRVSFGGAGDRGVTNGIDTRTYFTVPLGLKVGF